MRFLLSIIAFLSLSAFAHDDGRAHIDWHPSRHPGKSVLVVTFHEHVYQFLVEDDAINEPGFVEEIAKRVFNLDAEEQGD